MSCCICFVVYDDHKIDQTCYNICGKGGHTVCKACSNRIDNCPLCQTPITQRVRIRINNEEQPQEETSLVQREMDGKETRAPLIFLLDTSGSMDNVSGTQHGAPQRIEMAVHIAKVKMAFCRKLGIPFRIYSFSEDTKLVVDEKMSVAHANRKLEALRPSGQTFFVPALKTVFQMHGQNSKYFIFTDGDPTESEKEYTPIIKLFNHSQMHLIAFSSDVATSLIKAVATNGLHTVSFIEDIRSLAGYLVPVFICAVTEMERVQLSEVDEACRQEFLKMLAPQVSGKTDLFKMEHIMQMLKTVKTGYARDLEADTDSSDQKLKEEHSRIAYSFRNKKNWESFGKYYLPVIFHDHMFLIPGNAFDRTLKHYRTEAYQKVFLQIASIPINIEFVSFMTTEKVQRDVASVAASKVMNQAFQYSDSYSRSDSGYDDGCISPEAQIEIVKKNGEVMVVPMKDVLPGDQLKHGGTIKWIVRISNLNHGKPIPLFNDLTPSHPVCQDGHWIPARAYKGAIVSYTTDVVYDVLLSDPAVVQ